MQLEKITDSKKAAKKRHYEDACGLALALELIGERWSLLVIRELILGPRRFGELRASLPGLSANVLTQRLEGLEASRILTRRKLPPPASVQVYELTDWGYECEPIIRALGRWAIRSPEHDPNLPASNVSIMMSFRTLFDPALAEGMDARIGCRFGDESFLIRIARGALTVAREDTASADVLFSGDAMALAGAVYERLPFGELAKAGMLEVTGDRALAERFVTLFRMPDKIA